MLPEPVAHFISSGWICAVALAILWLETLVLLARRRAMRSLLLANALSGSFLIAALGSALLGADVAWTAAALAAAFAAHLADLAYRLAAGSSRFRRRTE